MFGKIKLNSADIAFSNYVRTRDSWTCMFCFRTKDQGWLMQCAHIFSRSRQNTRFDPDNAICLCARCHDAFHSGKRAEKESGIEFPIFSDWIKQLFGEQKYDLLKYKSQQRGRKPNKLEIKELTKFFKNLTEITNKLS